GTRGTGRAAGAHQKGHDKSGGHAVDDRVARHRFTGFSEQVVIMLTRRYFIRASAIAVAGMGAAPSWLVRAAVPAAARGKILIAIFQRGAADGLNIVVPHFEKRYYELRPTIGVPPPGKDNGAIDLDGRFGLHPSLQPLKSLWDSRQLAIIHAAGSPDGNRSHFEAQDSMES